jgi:hypothetical protein
MKTRTRDFISIAIVLGMVTMSASFLYAVELVYKALNPRATPHEVKLFPLTSRVTDYSGKVVYVISQHVGDADIFLKKVAKELPKYLPGVKAVYKDKPSAYMTDDPEVWNEVAKNAQAFVYG